MWRYSFICFIIIGARSVILHYAVRIYIYSRIRWHPNIKTNIYPTIPNLCSNKLRHSFVVFSSIFHITTCLCLHTHCAPWRLSVEGSRTFLRHYQFVAISISCFVAVFVANKAFCFWWKWVKCMFQLIMLLPSSRLLCLIWCSRNIELSTVKIKFELHWRYMNMWKLYMSYAGCVHRPKCGHILCKKQYVRKYTILFRFICVCHLRLFIQFDITQKNKIIGMQT
jgi:putative flippase GtrA